MKRLLIIPVMFIYLVAVSGIMINLHYCGQELESWNLFAGKNSCEDGACGDESDKSDDCCKDKVITAKVSGEQNSIAAIKLKLQVAEWPVALLPAVYSYNAPVYTSIYRSATNFANAPPGSWQQIPLYKLHSSFTYYG